MRDRNEILKEIDSIKDISHIVVCNNLHFTLRKRGNGNSGFTMEIFGEDSERTIHINFDFIRDLREFIKNIEFLVEDCIDSLDGYYYRRELLNELKQLEEMNK